MNVVIIGGDEFLRKHLINEVRASRRRTLSNKESVKHSIEKLKQFVFQEKYDLID